MVFLGHILGADDLSAPITPTDMSNITKVRLQYGTFDDIYISKSTDITPGAYKPKAWDWNTILFADFEDSTLAGNLLTAIDSITHLIVKRRRKDQFRWITINAKTIEHPEGATAMEMAEQLQIHGTDLTAAIGYEYEYAAVPVMSGVEGLYSVASVLCESNNVVILDDTEIWATPLEDDRLTTTAVVPNAVVETMYDVYPTIVRNTDANYETISVSATFIPGLEECDVDWEDERGLVLYNRRAYNFLRNGRPKILKAVDGRIWLVYVTTPPTDQFDQGSNMRKLTFQCTEIGNVENEEDLFYANQIFAGEEWWNT